MFSCHDPYPGYTRNEEGIYYRLLEVGDRDKCCHFGNYITVNLTYKTLDDSVFFSGIRKFKVTDPGFPGSIDQCFCLMCEHDSAEFIISLVDFFEKTLESSVPDHLQNHMEMKLSVKMLDIQTTSEYLKEKEAFLHWVEDFGAYEKLLLQQYIRKEKIGAPPVEDGIYYIVQQAGTGPAVRRGDTVTVHYEGRFLNGRFFDSTYLRNEPFQFVYGEQEQVIRGLEKIIGRMCPGEKALVVIPSDQAFGIEGTQSGIIPPFTPVVYKIELINVK
jgi:FKBP-type peptidyl-prolyl cis-trans isomerase